MRSQRLSSLAAAVVLCACGAAGARTWADVSRAQEVRARVFKLLNEGVQAYKEGRQKDAIPLLQEAADTALNSFRAYYFLGLALQADRQYQRAIDPLQISLELDPVNLQARVALGDCYLKRGDPAEALAEYHRALSQQDDYAPAYDGLGRAAEAAGDDEKAIANYRKAIALNPGFPDAALNLGDLFMRDGRYNEAIELFLRAIKVRPDFAAAYNRLGVAYANQRLGNEAIAALKQAELLERGNPWHPVTIGGIFMGLDDLVQAGVQFDQALKLDPDYLEGYLAKAGQLRREGKLEEASHVVDAGLSRNVEDARAQAKLRELKERLGREAKQLAEVRERLSAGGRSRADLIALADLESEFGDDAEAAALLEEAANPGAGEPPDTALLERLAYSSLRSGLYEQAAQACERLLAASPDQADVLINLGLARLELGDRPGAQEALTRAGRARPGDWRPPAYLANLYVLDGQPGKAVESLQASLALMGEGAEERQRVERLLTRLQASQPAAP